MAEPPLLFFLRSGLLVSILQLIVNSDPIISHYLSSAAWYDALSSCRFNRWQLNKNPLRILNFFFALFLSLLFCDLTIYYNDQGYGIDVTYMKEYLH
jgi:hypothetical protein